MSMYLRAVMGLLRRKDTALFGALFFVYIFAVPSKYDVSFDGVFKGVEPNYIWDYMSDFNNMKKLNPTITSFEITSDNGSSEKWEYGVYYTEYLSSLPFITNSARAHYEIYKTLAEQYIIKSKHKTCFIANILCLQSWSLFTCSEHSGKKKDSYCREDVTYECPKIFSFWCHREVMYQRRAIFKNLLFNHDFHRSKE